MKNFKKELTYRIVQGIIKNRANIGRLRLEKYNLYPYRPCVEYSYVCYLIGFNLLKEEIGYKILKIIK